MSLTSPVTENQVAVNGYGVSPKNHIIVAAASRQYSRAEICICLNQAWITFGMTGTALLVQDCTLHIIWPVWRIKVTRLVD